MPWNEPGNTDNRNKDPWNTRNSKQPPDLDKMLGDAFKQLRQKFSFAKLGPGWQGSNENKAPQYTIGIVLVILLALWFVSGFYIVNPAEEAVMLRLGKFNTTQLPGLHWMARFIDTKYLVDIKKIYSFPLQGDFLTKSSEQNTISGKEENKSVSADQSKNLVNVEMSVQYRINNSRAYLFNVVNTDDTIRQVAAGALSDVVGKMKLDDVLTTGREQLSQGVLERSRQMLNMYNAGVEIVSVNLRKAQSPDQVRAAFNDVNRADQDRATTIQQAEAYASKVVPIAQGFAARTLADATAYQQQAVLTAQANISKYEAVLSVYKNAPDITRERMYLEAMQNIYSHTTKILIDSNANNNLVYLPLDKLLKNAAASAEVKNG